jgi:serine/arginine repetitive matrix protein 1
MRKVELSVMRPWIARKVSELLGFEDEVVIEYVNGLLEDETNPVSEPSRFYVCLQTSG